MVYPDFGFAVSPFLVPVAQGTFASETLWAVETSGSIAGGDWSRIYARDTARSAPSEVTAQLANNASAPIPGGGLGGGEQTSTLTVFAQDAYSGEAIAGAKVLLGAADAREVAVTNADGRAVLAGITLGSVPITVEATNYVPLSWQGVKAASVTVPLQRSDHEVRTAQVTATIAGFEQLPLPAAGETRETRFGFSQPTSVHALEAGDVPESENCSADCELTGPLDAAAVFAVIVDRSGSTSGQMVGFAVASGLKLSAGSRTSVILTMLAQSSLTRATLGATMSADSFLPDPLVTDHGSSYAVSNTSTFRRVTFKGPIGLQAQVLLGPGETNFALPAALNVTPLTELAGAGLRTSDGQTGTQLSIESFDTRFQTTAFSLETLVTSPRIAYHDQ